MERHTNFEKVSFHTPGHKGRLNQIFDEANGINGAKGANGAAEKSGEWLAAVNDLTELPGLDELAHPQGVLLDIEQLASTVWQSEETFLSVNGASAALMAAILAARQLGEFILMPRNAHRAAIQGAIMAGLTPLWYEPVWETSWGFWGSTPAAAVEQAIKDAAQSADSQSHKIAAVLVVSPTYQGAFSDIAAVSAVAHSQNIAVIVDEAHGAHLNSDDGRSALNQGADAVAHSLHKTLPGLTQTGLLHLGRDSLLDSHAVRRSLNFVSSSSPSYLLLASLERTIRYFACESGQNLCRRLVQLNHFATESIKAIGGLRVYDTARGTTPSHILVSAEQEDAASLYNYLIDRGIFAEAVLGKGVLFMLGAGSCENDLEILIQHLTAFVGQEKPVSPLYALANKSLIHKPGFDAVMSPAQAVASKSRVVNRIDAPGEISAEIVCPCPPGIPLLIPGQRITEEVLEFSENKQFTVVAR